MMGTTSVDNAEPDVLTTAMKNYGSGETLTSLNHTFDFPS